MTIQSRILRPILPGLFLLTALLPLACERATDLGVDGDGFLVVECVLTQEVRQTVRLTLSAQGSEDAYGRLKKARVCVYDETEGILAGTFDYWGKDTWESYFAGQPGHSYRLEIEAEGYGTVSARTTMPARPHIKYSKNSAYRDHVKHTDKIEEAVPALECGVRFMTSSLPEGPVWIKGTDGTDYRPDGAYLESRISASVRELATSILNADPFNLTGESWHHPKAIQWIRHWYGSSVNDYSEYATGWYWYLEDQPVHEKYIRIPSIHEVGPRETKEPDNYFSVSCRIPYPVSYVYPVSYYDFENLAFMCPSEEYDRYLKELLVEASKREEANGRFAALFRHENMYTNIVNGMGVFGACIQVEAKMYQHGVNNLSEQFGNRELE